MKKNIIVVIFGIILLVSILCGCTGTQVENKYENVFESDVTNLLEYNTEQLKDREGRVGKVTVNGRIENIVDRQIDVTITAKFYDANDNYLGESFFKIIGLRAKPNAGHSTTFSISYNEQNANKIDHFVLHVEEGL
jgi:hypothetical protein